MYFRFIILLSAICCIGARAFPQVVTSSTPLAKSLNLYSDKYQVTVSQNGKSYTSYTYVSTATGSESKTELGKTFNYSIFSFSQPVTVAITKLNSSASSAIIRPNRAGLGKINASVDGSGSKIQFTLTKPSKLSVEFSDDPSLSDALLIVADSLEIPANVPNPGNSDVYTVTGDQISPPTGKDILYFPPGLHTIGYYSVPTSIKQIYLANGSFVRGYFSVNRQIVKNPIMINGRGILSADIYPFHYPETTLSTSSGNWYKMILIQGGSNHIVEGITITDASAYNIMVSNCQVRNVNINGFKLNNDGIATGGVTCTIDNCFLHVGDDALVLYGSNITVKNSVFWQLGGGSIVQLGWYPNTITGTNFIQNIDVIHAAWNDNTVSNIGFINAMNSYAGSAPGLVENFTIQDIYFDTNILRFLDIRMVKNGIGQPGNFKNFAFNNIHITTGNHTDVPLIYLHNYNSTYTVSGFTFKNLYINNVICNQNSWNNDYITTDTPGGITILK